jgi:hypothetical protein
MTEIYENEAQKICKKRPTGQEMEELYKKRGISTRNEEALKKPGMRKVSKKERGLKHKNEEVLDLMRKFHKKSGNLQRRDFKKKWGSIKKLRNTLTKWRVPFSRWWWQLCEEDRHLQPQKVFCWIKRFLKSEVPLLDISNNKNGVALEKIEKTRRGALKAIRKIVRKNGRFLESYMEGKTVKRRKIVESLCFSL